jgi:hypothetical protein
MSNTDARKFKYSIESIRQRQIWRRDMQQAQLARVQRDSHAASEQLKQMQGHLVEQAAQASLAWCQRPDPQSQTRVLAHLTQSQGLIKQANWELQAIQTRLNEARQACVVRQRELELTESHRQSCLQAHITQEQRAMAAQADDEWITRQLWLSYKAGSA